MRSPFPGMDPYLEHPSIWPDLHAGLLVAIRDAMTPLVAPRYFIGLERRIYTASMDEAVLIGIADIGVSGPSRKWKRDRTTKVREGAVAVEVPVQEFEVRERFLEVRSAPDKKLVTVVELLSPSNKLGSKGRAVYEAKREKIFKSRTNLVEIDLVRAGSPMPLVGEVEPSDYRVLVSRGWERPRSDLYPFDLEDALPSVPLPLVRGEAEPMVPLGELIGGVYERARYDLQVDYSKPPAPPFDAKRARWAKGLIGRLG